MLLFDDNIFIYTYMKLNQLNIEELVEMRTKMILENQSTREINILIDKKEREYADSILEDATGGPGGASNGGGNCFSGGVAYGNGGVGGMGSVVAAQPSTYAGSTIGSDWSDHGGTTGSGDISNPMLGPGGKTLWQKAEMGSNHGSRTGKKSRKKRMSMKTLKDTFAKRQDFTVGSSDKPKRVMNFDDFQKDNLNKIKR